MCASKILCCCKRRHRRLERCRSVRILDVGRPVRCAALDGVLRCSSAKPSAISVIKKPGSNAQDNPESPCLVRAVKPMVHARDMAGAWEAVV